jgi:hypothetical protein
MTIADQIPFEQFREEWLADIREGDPSTTARGHRFARKLLCQWLDIEDSSDDLVYCDGAGDGGIDIAYLNRGEGQDAEGEGRAEGHTWYLVQGKYGSAFAGPTTLLEEAQKVVDTLDGKRTKLSSLTQGLVERISNFRRQASELDRIVLVFGTVDPLSETETRVLADVRAIGRARLGSIFDAVAISVETIYRRAQEQEISALPVRRVALRASLMRSGGSLLVGAVSLLAIYDFLKAYRTEAGDLDELYEKNVRRFLGSRGRVNKAMQQTLKETPERFGLYNNGITIVVADFRTEGDGIDLTEPYVVNGCQTTRTIWEVAHQRLEAGGTGSDQAIEDWKRRAAEGSVVTKIVKVGPDGEKLLEQITRYTNTQNAVREKDFIALQSDFRAWARLVADTYGLFLEVQRGGWDSRRAFQKQNPSARQFTEAANAFDLLKVYAAGWLGEAGTAFGRNAAFVPTGSIFKKIVNAETDSAFGVDDLYAAYGLQRAAERFAFGRGADKQSRRQTKFLFHMVAVDLLRDVLIRNRKPSGAKDITNAFVRLFKPGNETAADALLDAAVNAIDEYMTPDMDDCVYKEPAFVNDFANDLNGFLKWEQLGKTDNSSPRFRSLLAVTKQTMGRKQGSGPSDRDRIAAAIF